MAKGAIVVSWGFPFPGYREKALKVFNEAMQLWTRLQQQREIESFEPVFLDYHGGLSGFVLIRGDREKLTRLRMNPDFENMNHRASLVVSDLSVIDGFTGDELQRRFADYQKHASELG
jgi:hypothetical protein